MNSNSRHFLFSVSIILAFTSVVTACSGHHVDKKSAPPPASDESDLTGPNQKPPKKPPFTSTEPNSPSTSTRKPFLSKSTALLKIDKIDESAGSNSQIEIETIYSRGGQNIKIENIDYSINDKNLDLHCDPAHGPYLAKARFENELYKITGNYRVYSVQLSAKCGRHYTLRFNETSAGGQVISIVETLEKAKARLQQEVGLEFWSDRININYPARSNYYALGTVNVTRGSQFEAVAHELGHAIYELGNIGDNRMGIGTQSSVTEKTGSKIHRIDECYSEELAYSEGWASFFAAWLYLDPNDADAHFTQLVPRRSPINIENIPADVCKGPANEWRVTAFFWDLIDAHNDGESAQFTFRQIWSALKDKSAMTARSAADLLIASGLNASQIRQAWQLNFEKPL